MAHPLCVTYKTFLFLTMVPQLRSVCLVSESALNRERVLKWGWMPLLQKPWGNNVQVWKHLHPNRSTLLVHIEKPCSSKMLCLFLKLRFTTIPQRPFLSGSVHWMWPKRLLGGKQMFSLFLRWRDFKITHSLPVRGVHLLWRCSHGNWCGTEGFVLQP